MYHSIGVVDKNWYLNHLTCPFQLFESILIMLKRKGYATITFSQLYEYIFEYKPIPDKAIIITFDDGYLDNYVFAYPLLKKYGFCGCIFPSTDFIENGIKRKTINEQCDIEKLETSGYLFWEELIEMEQSGVMEIQCHAQSHSYYFRNNKIIDFRHPNDPYYWMTWNENIKLKPKLFYDDFALVRFGEPVYQFQPSLSGRRFFPDPRLNLSIKKFLVEIGGSSFFYRENWRRELMRYYETFIEKNGDQARFESQEEFENRIYNELNSSKKLLEDQLHKQVTVLCWPNGSATSIGVQTANKLGFKLNTAGRDMLNTRHLLSNSPINQSNRIFRLSPSAYWNGKFFSATNSKYASSSLLFYRIKSYSESRISAFVFRILHKMLHTKVIYYNKVKSKILKPRILC